MSAQNPSAAAALPASPMSTLASATAHDRIIGTIFGSALGDAIGLYTEFLTAKQSDIAYPSRTFKLLPREEATPFRRDHHRSPHHIGDWTDDTDHSLLILLSFLHSDGQKMEPTDFASRLRTWIDMGLRALDTVPLGLGRTVGTIARKKAFLDDPEGTAREVWIKGGRNIAPNGSLMRTHPLGLACSTKSLEETFDIAARYSIVTHVDPRCVVSCIIGTALVRGLVRGEVSEEEHIDKMIDAGVEWYQRWRDEKEKTDETRKEDPPLDLEELHRHARVASLSELELDDGGKIGYVYKTFGSGVLLLRLAMRRMSTTNSKLSTQLSIFEELITDLIMQGGDADTNACFAGALLGACLGYKALPPNWRDGLRHGPWLLEKAEGLCNVLEVTNGSYVGSEDKDTSLDGGRGFLTMYQIEERWALLRAWIVQEDQEHKRREEANSKRKSFFGSMPWSK